MTADRDRAASAAGGPMVVPTLYGFDAGTLYLHGSVASQSLNTAGTQRASPSR